MTRQFWRIFPASNEKSNLEKVDLTGMFEKVLSELAGNFRLSVQKFKPTCIASKKLVKYFKTH
jgi:hypothetical protein